MCVCPAFSFLVQIPVVYAKYRSLYAKISALLSKWPGFYSKILVLERTRKCRTVRLLWGVGGVTRAKCVIQK